MPLLRQASAYPSVGSQHEKHRLGIVNDEQRRFGTSNFSNLSLELKHCSEILSSSSFQLLEKGEREIATHADALRSRVLVLADLAHSCAQQQRASNASMEEIIMRHYREATIIRQLCMNLTEGPESLDRLDKITVQMEIDLQHALAEVGRQQVVFQREGLRLRFEKLFSGKKRKLEPFMIDIIANRSMKTNYVPMFVLVNYVQRYFGPNVTHRDVRMTIEDLVNHRLLSAIRNVGGIDIVEFVPATIDDDQLTILKIAAQTPSLLPADCMMKLGWTQDRVMRAMKGLEIGGIATQDMSSGRWLFELSKE